MQIYEEYFSLLLENLMLVETSNQKIRIKKNYKPKANDKGKENAIFFEILFFENENKILTCRTLHVLESISNSTANHSKFQLGNKKPWEISKEV